LLWTWYDGFGAAANVKRPHLPEGFKMPDQGSLLVGEAGILLLPNVAKARLFPQEELCDYTAPSRIDSRKPS